MVAGVNGAGKTTSIGKLTRHLADSGASVLLAAADTFRAAAREQLGVWADRNTVDIISMVKHAAKETEPLLSPEERVNKAILTVTEGKHLNDEQQKWMEYIREHLKQNMTLDEEDLKELPVFTDRGGLRKFKRVFPGEYEIIINEINRAIAA